jgi:hypothetical protein
LLIVRRKAPRTPGARPPPEAAAPRVGGIVPTIDESDGRAVGAAVVPGLAVAFVAGRALASAARTAPPAVAAEPRGAGAVPPSRSPKTVGGEPVRAVAVAPAAAEGRSTSATRAAIG